MTVSPTQFNLLAQRVHLLENRFAEIETSHGVSLYQLKREAARNRLEMATILRHLGLTGATDAEIDAMLDEE